VSDSRRAGFWLDTYLQYTQQSEAPTNYHMWSAISVIASCLQRKVWLNWGFFNIFPNLYIVLVGPPGTRKNTAIGIATSMADKVKNIHYIADSTTGASIVEELKLSLSSEATSINKHAEPIRHSSVTIVAEELSVFFIMDKDMMKWLTDWFDCKDKWEYKTKGRGTYPIEGEWVNLIGGATPTSFASTVSATAIGEGFASRLITVVEDAPRKLNARPKLTPEEVILYNNLTFDIQQIAALQGEFTLSIEADKWFTHWYEHPTPNPMKDDERFMGYFSRKHIHLLKTSMVISASISNNKIITLDHIQYALDILENTETRLSDAFGAAGRSVLATDIDDIMKLLKMHKRLAKEQVFGQIWRNVNPINLEHIFTVLKEAKAIKEEVIDAKVYYVWLKNLEDINMEDLPKKEEKCQT